MHSFFYGGRWAGRRFAGPAVAGASMGRLAAFSLPELRSALDSAPLHLVHGLRPMRKGRGYGALMQAWGGIPPSFSRTAHCLRGHYTSNFLICIVRRREEGVIFTVKFCVWAKFRDCELSLCQLYPLPGGLMSFGRGIFQAFMYFCFGLLGLSGMDILNLPVSRRGVRYFFLKYFLSDNPGK